MVGISLASLDQAVRAESHADHPHPLAAQMRKSCIFLPPPIYPLNKLNKIPIWSPLVDDKQAKQQEGDVSEGEGCK